MLFNGCLCDAHCDTLGKITDGTFDLQFCLESTKAPYIQTFAAFIGEGPSPQRRVDDLIGTFYSYTNRHNLHVCKTYQDMILVRDKGLKGAILAIEGGEALCGNLENIDRYCSLGVRMLTLTWNNKNQLASGALSPEDCGLTSFGAAAVERMQECAMVVDVSHIGENGFWDVMACTKKPVMASHSNSRAICDHPRNLTDDMFTALVKNRGCVGINFYPLFLRGPEANIWDIIAHIEHFLELGGEDNVCFGTDLDGIDSLPVGVAGTDGLYSVINLLLQRNYTERTIKKIASDNFFRVFRENMK